MITKIFDSLGEMSRYIQDTPRIAYNVKHGFCESELISPRKTIFTGTESFEAADELLLKGYDAGVEALQRYSTQNVSRNYKVVTSLKNDVCGVIPNVGAYLTGDPRNMINIGTRKVMARSKVINLIVNTIVCSYVTTEEIAKVNGSILRNVIELERSGYSVNLYLLNSITPKKFETLSIFVKIKSSNERLNLLKVAYPIVHPSFLRRHAFAVAERLGRLVNTYGYPNTLTNEDIEKCTGIKKAIVINTKNYTGVSGDVYAKIRANIEKQLK